jgi:hypothetical protein
METSECLTEALYADGDVRAPEFQEQEFLFEQILHAECQNLTVSHSFHSL